MVDETTIGGTPLVDLEAAADPTVYGKVEWLSLHDCRFGGSVKSRIARAMLDAAEAAGDLPGRTILEPSSGNTGVALARVGGARGHDVEVVMPDDTGHGKIAAIRDAGGEVHLLPGERGYDAIFERCDELEAAHPERYLRPDQYTNPENPGAHERTTAPEMWTGTDGRVTHVVAGAGTGGTVTGLGRGLPDAVTLVGYEPAAEAHDIHGLRYLRTGNRYHPATYDESVLDGKVYVDTADARDHARALRERFADRPLPIHDAGQFDEATVRANLRVDGEFLVGPSSGGALAAVHDLAGRGALGPQDVVVVPLCDRGDRYPEGPLWGDRL